MANPVSIDNIKSLFKNSSSLQKIRNSLGLGNTLSSLPIANGGTGATTKDSAWKALGGGEVGKINLTTIDAKKNFLRGDGEWQTPTITLNPTNNSSSSRPIFFKSSGDLTEIEVSNLYFDEEFTFNPSTNKLNVGGGIINMASTTVLYSGTGSVSSIKLSQDPTNFDVLEFLYAVSTTRNDVSYSRILNHYWNPTGTAYSASYQANAYSIRRHYFTRSGTTITLKETVLSTEKVSGSSVTTTATTESNSISARYVLGHKFN